MSWPPKVAQTNGHNLHGGSSSKTQACVMFGTAVDNFDFVWSWSYCCEYSSRLCTSEHCVRPRLNRDKDVL